MFDELIDWLIDLWELHLPQINRNKMKKQSEAIFDRKYKWICIEIFKFEKNSKIHKKRFDSFISI